VHARHLYTLLINDEQIGRSRDQIVDDLIRLRIGTGVHYTALHLHPYYQRTFGYGLGDFPNAEYIGARTMSLPFSSKLTDQDMDDVIDAVRTVTLEPTRT
jgi:dTDP-4-amino-4,6-dideoxygalactose transaminase